MFGIFPTENASWLSCCRSNNVPQLDLQLLMIWRILVLIFYFHFLLALMSFRVFIWCDNARVQAALIEMFQRLAQCTWTATIVATNCEDFAHVISWKQFNVAQLHFNSTAVSLEVQKALRLSELHSWLRIFIVGAKPKERKKLTLPYRRCFWFRSLFSEFSALLRWKGSDERVKSF